MGRSDLACSASGEADSIPLFLRTFMASAHADRTPAGVPTLSRAANNMATMTMPAAAAARGRSDIGGGGRGSLPYEVTRDDAEASSAGDGGGGSSAADKSNGEGGAVSSSCDGTELGTQLPLFRFGRDQRLKEVQRILRSSRPGLLRVVRAPESNDHDFLDQQQKKLQQLANRTMAIPVGRGAFTLFTGRMTITDPLPIPALNLSGKLPPNNAIVSMDTSSLPNELQKWPSFHNGVAAGLRLAPQQSHASRTWIVYNKPDTLTDEHAGVLLALGLTGQLSSLASADLVWYLSQRHESTAVGVMLGMAAARRGSMDHTISKMLCMHILAFHPPTFPELDVSSNLQTAAIMGIALLFQGTANRFMTEVLLGEIGRRASDSISVDREGYSLAAGIALGFVTLGRGNTASGLADLHIEDRLRRFMAGGKDPDAAVLHEHGLSASNYASQAQCSRIKEGEVVNVDITAPAATLALGLMYLRTNNTAIGEQLAIPDTHFLLDYVRPDLILLRILARNLVLWDSIAPTEQWVQAQIPEMIKQSIGGPGAPGFDDAEEEVDIDYEAVRHAHWNILAGACMGLGLRYAGQANSAAQQLLLRYIKFFQGHSAAKLTPLDKPIMESCL
jgi:anaphase-promoting complex subunit 1